MKFILDGSYIEDKTALHATLKEGLNLPDWYGGNLDALYDCLTERQDQTVICIRHADLLEENLGGYARAFLHVLEDAAEEMENLTVEISEAAIDYVLFDLDGTLLPMDYDLFVKQYFGLMARKMIPYGYDPETLPAVIWKSTGAMFHNDGSKTNEEAFWTTFSSILGDRVYEDKPIFEDYYVNDFPQVKAICSYTPMADETVKLCRDMGARVVLATNPLFPEVATMQRMDWAGLDPADFELITTYEDSTYCKPNLNYYREVLEKIGADPERCVMVGNDVEEDMCAAQLGMKVFLLTDDLINKKDVDIEIYPHGGFAELQSWLKGLL